MKNRDTPRKSILLGKAAAVRALAGAVVAGSFEREQIEQRIASLLSRAKTPRWLGPLIERLLTTLGAGHRPTLRSVVAAIQADENFHSEWVAGRVHFCDDVSQRSMLMAAGVGMAPASSAAAAWAVPPATNLSDLADLLGLHIDDLGWLTSYGSTEHYLYRWHKKRSGGGGRLISIAKPLLRQAQRAMLDRVLECIPSHDAVHGFRRGRSVRSAVEPHCGQRMVLRIDLEDFFPSVTAGRVLHLFLTAGYPETVARAMTRLCTQRPPAAVVEKCPAATSRSSRERMRIPHLPQGAPSSPALANLAAFRLDCRLAGLASACGANYTRYADDLIFSGGNNFARGAEPFAVTVAAIALECGFSVAHRKTRLMRHSVRQRVAGVVVNEKPNVARADFDRLKATLTNCARLGVAGQNRSGVDDFRAHLAGRLTWVATLNPARGEKLRRIFEQIDW